MGNLCLQLLQGNSCSKKNALEKTLRMLVFKAAQPWNQEPEVQNYSLTAWPSFWMGCHFNSLALTAILDFMVQTVSYSSQIRWLKLWCHCKQPSANSFYVLVVRNNNIRMEKYKTICRHQQEAHSSVLWIQTSALPEKVIFNLQAAIRDGDDIITGGPDKQTFE